MEILEECVASSRPRCNPRGLKRKMSNYPFKAIGFAVIQCYTFQDSQNASARIPACEFPINLG